MVASGSIDLPADTHQLPQDAAAEHPNSLRRGPSVGVPPRENHPHRSYVFMVCALNVEKLDVPADSGGAMVNSIARDHLIGERVFVGHYPR
jgi:phosphatidylethanolamine-binding protein (PEBP) family uncharacterized protein